MFLSFQTNTANIQYVYQDFFARTAFTLMKKQKQFELSSEEKNDE